MPSLIKQISSRAPEQYTDGSGVTRYVYEPWYVKFGRGVYHAVGDFLNGKDWDLSNEEYMAKYGYGKPVGGMGTLAGQANPAGVAKLAKLGEALKAEEELKAAKAAQQATRNKAIIDKADDVTFNTRTGRPHLRKRKAGPKTYEKVDYVPKERPVVTEAPKTETQKKLDELWSQYNWHLGKAQNAANQGYEGAYETIMKEAAEIKAEIERLSPPDYRLKYGGRLKRR